MVSVRIRQYQLKDNAKMTLTFYLDKKPKRTWEDSLRVRKKENPKALFM